MGKKAAARQASPMWVNTEDLPTSSGHPFFERLNRILAESGFDAFVEGLCTVFYAERLGRPSLRQGRYFRLLLIGYFEGLSSERGIAWRVSDSLSLRSFLDLGVTEAAPGHSTVVADAAAGRPRDAHGGIHVGGRAVGQVGSGAGQDGRHRCDDAGSERGDAEHRAARYRRVVRGVRAAPGGGVRDCDADARGVGAVRPIPEGQEDVEQGVAVAPGSGREDCEAEGRPNALGSQGRARG